MFIVYFKKRILSLICLSFFCFEIAELDALESDREFESAAVLPYLQSKTDFTADLNLPAGLQQSKQVDR
jgi:hypothetical protein